MLNPMPEVSIGEIENIDILCPPVLLHTPTHPTLEMDNVKQTPNSWNMNISGFLKRHTAPFGANSVLTFQPFWLSNENVERPSGEYDNNVIRAICFFIVHIIGPFTFNLWQKKVSVHEKLFLMDTFSLSQSQSNFGKQVGNIFLYFETTGKASKGTEGPT